MAKLPDNQSTGSKAKVLKGRHEFKHKDEVQKVKPLTFLSRVAS